jgi:hypothetical protein
MKFLNLFGTSFSGMTFLVAQNKLVICQRHLASRQTTGRQITKNHFSFSSPVDSIQVGIG